MLALALFAAAVAGVARAEPPAKATPTMSVEEVRPGMKGYGLSVFRGVVIEPFAVEVVNVMRNFNPGGDVVWIRCPEDRLQESGPVHGMSGSPIYLWAEGEPQVMGKGGRLIGAFAYGFETSKNCYAGVQPIANMMGVGSRAPEGDKVSESTAPSAPATPSIKEMLASPEFQDVRPSNSYRARMMARMFEQPARPGEKERPAADSQPRPSYEVRTPALTGTARPMMIPLSVGSPAAARIFGPLLERMGFAATFATGPMQAGTPPPGLDIKNIQLAPGSVLAIPLGWGDADLSASGTVTDVLPDGRVLAFGHAMFGQGDSAVPMATGFVTFVMPSIISSFKLGGSGIIQGTIVRDENSAVVGRPGIHFTTAPVRVAVSMPAQPRRTYNYQVVNHRELTPMLTAILALQSSTAAQSAPSESTAHMTGAVTFAGGRRLEFNSLSSGGGGREYVMDLYMPLLMLNGNPFDRVVMESADLDIRVEPGTRVVTLVSARLDNNEVAPGDKVGITLKLQPYGKPAFERRLSFPLPRALDDGDYTIQVSGASEYLAAMFNSHPHLLQPTSVDEQIATLQRILSTRADAIYTVLQLHDQGLAIGRQELPRLPSSRRALLSAPTSTQSTEFAETLERIEPNDSVVEGALGFTVTVRKSLADRSR